MRRRCGAVPPGALGVVRSREGVGVQGAPLLHIPPAPELSLMTGHVRGNGVTQVFQASLSHSGPGH